MKVIYQLIYLVFQTLYFFFIAVPIAIILFIILQIVDFVKKRASKFNRRPLDKQLNK
jgi:hypothetical protein